MALSLWSYDWVIIYGFGAVLWEIYVAKLIIYQSVPFVKGYYAHACMLQILNLEKELKGF